MDERHDNSIREDESCLLLLTDKTNVITCISTSHHLLRSRTGRIRHTLPGFYCNTNIRPQHEEMPSVQHRRSMDRPQPQTCTPPQSHHRPLQKLGNFQLQIIPHLQQVQTGGGQHVRPTRSKRRSVGPLPLQIIDQHMPRENQRGSLTSTTCND